MLIEGDCLEVMMGMGPESVDAVIADPPYNSGVKYLSYNDKIPDSEYWDWMRAVVGECNRIGKLVLIKHSAMKIYDWCVNIGKTRMVCWYKPFSSGFRVNGFATHFEPIWVTKGKIPHWSKDVIVQNSGACNREKSFNHPAQMPEGLATQLINICTLEGQTILDPFAGSGTTGVACINTNRKFILIEKDAGYCEIIRKRLADTMPLLAVNE